MNETRTISQSPWITFVRLQNPLMKWLLGSPLHFFASRTYMLITVTGRKTGKRYTTPVQYAQTGDELVIVTSEAYRWWRNLIGGAEVELRLRGRSAHGVAQVTADPKAVEATLGRLYPQIKSDKRASFAAGKAAIKIRLTP
ncbi:MAG: nitroreductase family deazaflavin-dependent oxidoreductase [Anaerolineae bacterium]|nr:nitroreductase family deazaflavin-dependent oxidoreductase [Anaerolineae bacterium]